MKLPILLALSVLTSAVAQDSIILNSHSRLRGDVTDDPQPLTSYYNKLLTLLMPILSNALLSSLPASFGNCNTNSPPQPCKCLSDSCDNLYSVHKSWEYEAYAHWIGGLNTLDLTDLSFISEGNNKLALQIVGGFGSLPASIYIGECVTFDRCHKLWDNTDGCCGKNVHFNVKINFDCNAADTSQTYLSNINVESIDLDTITLTESIGSIRFDVTNLTGALQSALHNVLDKAVTQPPFIPWPPQAGSPTYDVLGLLNVIAKLTTKGAPILCS